jgi:hypothetical protein
MSASWCRFGAQDFSRGGKTKGASSSLHRSLTVSEVGKLHGLHEASVVSHDGFLGMPLDQALFATTPPREHSTLASATTLQTLADDKHLVGALGSACNRTCAFNGLMATY